MSNVSSKKEVPSKKTAPGKKKAFSKYQAKRTTASMKRRPTLERCPGVEVGQLIEDIVSAVESEAEVVPAIELPLSLDATAVSVSHSKVGGKRNPRA
ncbi:hypothetical protein DVH05_006048 [Phytophthora capsici]|nr:hypothetical protein DVH05_006048 [Phytophthora capsici]